MSLAEQHRDTLDIVEDELLLLLKDSEVLLSCLKDLPNMEEAAKEAAKSLLDHLAKVQDGLMDNVNLLADYIPYERSATQSRLRARQAKADLTSACSALETFPLDDGDEGSLEGRRSDDDRGYVEERSVKRMRRQDT
jgi:hypothetical protein